MDPSALRQRLRIDEAIGDAALQADLQTVLMGYFPKGRYPGQGVVEHLTADDNLALVARHDESGVKDIQAGPALTQNDLDALARQVDVVFADTTTAVRRAILFSDLPVTGSYRYRDQFRIMPAPPEAPKLEQVLGDHPFVLEVVHRSSDNTDLRIQRGIREVQTVSLLLSGLIPWIVCERPGHLEQRWAIRLRQGSADSPSEWVQLTYMFPGFQALADEMTSDPGTPIELIEADGFYAKRGIRPDDVLQLPLSFELMLDHFYALGLEKRDQFLRWAYWLNHAKQIWNLSHSAHYLALIQAVEALRPRLPGSVCQHCRSQTGPGPTQQFVDFVERHPPRQDPETERERRELYRLRSALTHGGKLLRRDLHVALFAGLEPAELKERESSDRAALLTRIAGVNWLLSAD